MNFCDHFFASCFALPACREREWAARFVDSSILEKDPEPSITVQGRLHHPNSIPYGFSGHTVIWFSVQPQRRNHLVCSLLLVLCSPHPVFWLSHLCQDLQKRRSWAYAVCFPVSLGASWCQEGQACSFLFYLSWWSRDLCSVYSQLLREHTKISPWAKVLLRFSASETHFSRDCSQMLRDLSEACGAAQWSYVLQHERHKQLSAGQSSRHSSPGDSK